MQADFKTNIEDFRKKVNEYGRRLTDEGINKAAVDLSYRASNAIKRDFLKNFYQRPMQGTSGGTVHTGRLRSSVMPIIRDKNTFGVSSNVIYARIHEFGGKTRPHWIYPRNKKALAWGGTYNKMGRYQRQRLGKMNQYGEKSFIIRSNFAKKVWHPGSTLKARYWMSRPMQEELTKYIDEQIAKLEKPL